VSGIAASGRGEHAAAIAACRRAVEMGMDPLSRALGTGRLGWAHLEAGDPAAAIPLLESAEADMRRLGLRHVVGQLLASLSEALLLTGRQEAALSFAREGLAMCQEAKYPFAVALAERAIGRAVLASSQPEKARRHLEAALQRFTAIGAAYEAMRTQQVLDESADAADRVPPAAPSPLDVHTGEG
jgi:tetratricopeptide (TPR) repeat protein